MGFYDRILGITDNGGLSVAQSNTTGVTVGTGVANDPLDNAAYLVLNYIVKR